MARRSKRGAGQRGAGAGAGHLAVVVALAVPLIGLASCGAQSASSTDAQDANDSRLATVDGGCAAAAATVLSCTLSAGVNAGAHRTCLSDDSTICRDDDGEPATCISNCVPGELAFLCGCLPEGGCANTDQPPAGDCRVVLHTPAGPTFYCCPRTRS